MITSNHSKARAFPSRRARLQRTLQAAALGAALSVFSTAQALDIVDITIADIQAGLANGTFSAVELLNAHMARINTYEPYYNAFTFFSPTAMDEALALDLEYATTGPRSPLHGVPIVIKEAMDVKGLPSTAGYDGFSSLAGGIDLIPETDAPVVARLREAGAIIIGKTNIPEFSRSGSHANTSWDGRTFNAYDRSLLPGGSSAGTATAVAGSFAVIGTAEETGGSIQNPAAAQSLVGLKVTFGLVPNAGVAPLAGANRDVVGPHARTVTDAALMLDVMAGYTLADEKTYASVGNMPVDGYTSLLSETALEGKRFGLWGPGWNAGDVLDPETLAMYEGAQAILIGQGATLVDDPFASSTFASLFSALPSSNASNPYYFEEWLERMGPSMIANQVAAANGTSSIAALEALGISPFAPGESFASTPTNNPEEFANPDVPGDIEAYFAARAEMLAEFNRVLDEYDLDGLFFPQALTPLQDIDTGSIRGTTVSEINHLGVPVLTVSGGYDADGAPFGVLFVGDLWSDAELLGYGFDWEQATMLRATPALVPLPAPLPLLGVAGLWLLRRQRTARAAGQPLPLRAVAA
ncbi:MAG: amidase [Gammaproteobacteria bacterium]